MKTTLPIPEAALGQHVIALGKTGAGKSSKLRVLVEHLLAHDRPVCLIDPKGDWWGLKSSADGRSSGFPIVIFGGEHADVPINAHAGAQIAELVATGNRSCLIDLGGWMVGERTRFFVDFASTLFKLTKGARHVAIDEVHNFAPKGKVFDPDAGKMLHWANRLASEGRGKGLTLLAASQRPQKVHNDFLTSCETLIACRVIHKADRDAIKDWIDGAADPAAGREVLAELASMKRPEAWVWSPEIEFGPERVTFPMFTTYDSFKPQGADAVKLKGWAAVDLEEVKSKLAAVMAEAEANDPRTLRKQIAELERELAAARDGAGIAPEDAEAMAAERAAAAVEEERARARAAVRPQVVALREAAELLARALEGGEGEPAPRAPVVLAKRESTYGNAPAPAAAAVRLPARRAPRAPAPQPDPAVEGLGGSPRKMLDAMAMLATLGVDEPTQATVAGWLAVSATTGTWRNNMSALRTRGLIEDIPGKRMRLTPVGEGIAEVPVAIPTRRQLHETWIQKLGGTQANMLRILIDAYPNPVGREDLARAIGISHTTGTFRNYMSDLRRPGIVRDMFKGGPLVATELLFPRGLR